MHDIQILDHQSSITASCHKKSCATFHLGYPSHRARKTKNISVPVSKKENSFNTSNMSDRKNAPEHLHVEKCGMWQELNAHSVLIPA
jgi:hypothetical protein